MRCRGLGADEALALFGLGIVQLGGQALILDIRLSSAGDGDPRSDFAKKHGFEGTYASSKPEIASLIPSAPAAKVP